MTSQWPRLSKCHTLRAGISTYEFEGDTNIQSVVASILLLDIWAVFQDWVIMSRAAVNIH